MEKRDHLEEASSSHRVLVPTFGREAIERPSSCLG